MYHIERAACARALRRGGGCGCGTLLCGALWVWGDMRQQGVWVWVVNRGK